MDIDTLRRSAPPSPAVRLLALGLVAAAAFTACVADDEADGPRPRLTLTVTPTRIDGTTQTTVDVVVTAVDAEARAGSGAVTLRSTLAGTFAGGAPEETLELQGGVATTTFRCARAEQPTCAGSLSLRAVWNDVRASALVVLPPAEAAGGAADGGGGDAGPTLGPPFTDVLLSARIDTSSQIRGWTTLDGGGAATVELPATPEASLILGQRVAYVKDGSLVAAEPDTLTVDGVADAGVTNDVLLPTPRCGLATVAWAKPVSGGAYAYACQGAPSYYLSSTEATYRLTETQVFVDGFANGAALIYAQLDASGVWAVRSPAGTTTPVRWPTDDANVSPPGQRTRIVGGDYLVAGVSSAAGRPKSLWRISSASGLATLVGRYAALSSPGFTEYPWIEVLSPSQALLTMGRHVEGNYAVFARQPDGSPPTVVTDSAQFCVTDRAAGRACLVPTHSDLNDALLGFIRSE